MENSYGEKDWNFIQKADVRRLSELNQTLFPLKLSTFVVHAFVIRL